MKEHRRWTVHCSFSKKYTYNISTINSKGIALVLDEYQKKKVDEIIKTLETKKDLWDKYDYLHKEYSAFVKENEEKIRVVIVGKAPFPTDPEGIAFCRGKWDDLSKENCSGNTVLNALFGDFSEVKGKFCGPIKFFFWLASQGIVFLNRYLENPLVREFASKDKLNMILCGEEAHKISDSKIKLIHPSNLAKAQNEKSWKETWENHNSFIAKIKTLKSDEVDDIKSVLNSVIKNISNIETNL